jgi:hypothetical protein
VTNEQYITGDIDFDEDGPIKSKKERDKFIMLFFRCFPLPEGHRN